jgi:hypothetical protein
MGLSEQRTAELEVVKEWCCLIMDFIIEREGQTGIEVFRDITIQLYENKNLRGIKQLSSEINDLAGALREADFADLNQKLLEKFGKNLVSEANKVRDEVNKIVENGKIRSAKEYRLVSQRAEEIYAYDEYRAELEVLNGLLIDFNQLKNKR